MTLLTLTACTPVKHTGKAWCADRGNCDTDRDSQTFKRN